MKFILTAGGTGGHIYPALSVLDEIKKDINCLKPSIDEKIKENLDSKLRFMV